VAVPGFARAIGACPGFSECLASIIFCAIIATGYLQDLEFRGWAHAEQKKEASFGGSS
jgi:hypothetical protein